MSGRTAAAATPTSPNLAEMSAEQLIERLGDPNLTVRTLATHELVDRIGKPAIGPLQKLLADEKSLPTQRAHGLWVLQRLGALTDALVEKLAADPDRLVRVHLIQALAERDWEKQSLDVAKLVRGKLADPDPFVKRAAVDALGRHPAVENVKLLAELLAHAPATDTHLIHSARIALRDQLANPRIQTALDAQPLKVGPGDDRRLFDVCLAVNDAWSAKTLFGAMRLPGDEYADRLADYAHHAARFLRDNDLNSLYRDVLARLRDKTSPSWQRNLLIAVHQGLQERGQASLPDVLAEFGVALAEKLLESDRDDELVLGVELVRELKTPGTFDRLAAIVTSDKAVAARYAAMDACVALRRTALDQAAQRRDRSWQRTDCGAAEGGASVGDDQH